MLSIDGKTTVCAVIGDPVEHSLSPCMHNAAFESLDLPFVYTAFHVRDVEKAVHGVLGFNIKGLSVTIPHKTTVMPYLDEIDDLSKTIGAVNTITNENGVLKGTNTDSYGALSALETCCNIENKSVLLLGVGGAARAIAFGLACEKQPANLVLSARNIEKANALLDDLKPNTTVNIQSVSFEEDDFSDIFKQSGIVINCTPVGMHPNVNECLIPEDWFQPEQVVFDTIYNPGKTLLLQRAEAHGGVILNGVPMFVHQGAKQFELWTGKPAPIEVMENAVKHALEMK